MTRLLVEHGANLNMQTVNGCTALHIAANGGHIECVHILLDAGAEIDLKNKTGHTAAKLALLQKRSPTLELLLCYGANAHLAVVLPKIREVRTEDEKKHAGAIVAALKEQPSVVHLLADHSGTSLTKLLDNQIDY
jgi:ankyrin repeat protein